MLRFLLPLLFASLATTSAKSLRIIPWDHEIAERKLVLSHSGGTSPIGHLHPSTRSEPIRVPAEATGLRIETPDRLDDQGKPYQVPIVIPSSIKVPLLLLLPDPKDGPGFRIKVMEDDKGSFEWGTFRIINVTSEPIAFTWEDKAKAVPTGWNPVDVSPKGEKRNMEVALYVKKSPKKPFYTSVWEHRPDMRQLVFLVPGTDPSLGPVECKFVPEKRLPQGAAR